MRMRMRQEQKLEQNLEQRLDFSVVIQEITDFFSQSGQSDAERLKELLSVVPQVQDGKVVYVVAGGWAVEILSGKPRHHDNINVLVLAQSNVALESNRCLDYLGVEFMESALNDVLVKKDVVEARWKRGRSIVYVPSPEFVIGTKLIPKKENGFHREKDIKDVLTLLGLYEPNTSKLSEVFNSFPYVRDGETVAEFVFQLGRHIRQHPRDKSSAIGLQSITYALQEQLLQYSKRGTFAGTKGVLALYGLNSFEIGTLKNYYSKENSMLDFGEWFKENKSVLVNPHGRVYHPSHPSPFAKVRSAVYSASEGQNKSLVFEDGAPVKDEPEIATAILSDAIKNSKCELKYTIQEKSDDSGSEKLVWSPSGRLIYENWKKA